jgi:TPR repeat protein
MENSAKPPMLKYSLLLYQKDAQFRGFLDFFVFGGVTLLFLQPPDVVDLESRARALFADATSAFSRIIPTPALAPLASAPVARTLASDRQTPIHSPRRISSLMQYARLSPNSAWPVLVPAVGAIEAERYAFALEKLQLLPDDDPNRLFLRAVIAVRKSEPVPEIMDWTARAAERGHPQAAFNLATLYAEDHFVPRDRQKAAEYYKKAYEGGHAPAAYPLAYYGFQLGWGGLKDLDKARKIYESPMFNDDQIALNNLATLYEQLARDKGAVESEAYLEKARNTYARAAALANYDSMFLLGRFMLKGIGGPTDSAEGMRWLRRSAEEGNSDAAQLLLGQIFSDGLFGQTVDASASVGYFRRAALHHNAAAQLAYARLLFEGRGTPKDVKQAYLQAMLAHRANAPGSQELVQEISKTINPADRDAVLKIAAEVPLAAGTGTP